MSQAAGVWVCLHAEAYSLVSCSPGPVAVVVLVHEVADHDSSSDLAQMRQYVDDRSARIADEEPVDSPRFIGQRIDNRQSVSHRFIVRRVNSGGLSEIDSKIRLRIFKANWSDNYLRCRQVWCLQPKYRVFHHHLQSEDFGIEAA
jgi:hypothetical protein